MSASQTNNNASGTSAPSAFATTDTIPITPAVTATTSASGPAAMSTTSLLTAPPSPPASRHLPPRPASSLTPPKFPHPVEHCFHRIKAWVQSDPSTRSTEHEPLATCPVCYDELNIFGITPSGPEAKRNAGRKQMDALTGRVCMLGNKMDALDTKVSAEHDKIDQLDGKLYQLFNKSGVALHCTHMLCTECHREVCKAARDGRMVCPLCRVDCVAGCGHSAHHALPKTREDRWWNFGGYLALGGRPMSTCMGCIWEDKVMSVPYVDDDENEVMEELDENFWLQGGDMGFTDEVMSVASVDDDEDEVMGELDDDFWRQGGRHGLHGRRDEPFRPAS
ncbi:hypothetical protein QBC34DRAFT_438733 [Podospora aff. communis PSN243]|uniref:RING-type domain-containing protein n=1 Tax=Podospora aff. communis PSN243 TaxID=3040156 RepID=A0AAV9GKA5_9PEZI|nr:hypothetical protein QBC34DRAFT_438733 [Podospora aff. communis PSN243]